MVLVPRIRRGVREDREDGDQTKGRRDDGAEWWWWWWREGGVMREKIKQNGSERGRKEQRGVWIGWRAKKETEAKGGRERDRVAALNTGNSSRHRPSTSGNKVSVIKTEDTFIFKQL